MHEEDGVDRREHVLHRSADAVVHVVVRLPFEDAEAGGLRVKRRHVAAEADVVFGRQAFWMVSRETAFLVGASKPGWAEVKTRTGGGGQNIGSFCTCVHTSLIEV